MFIEQPARFLRWIYPNAVWRMDPSEKAVYLTFDDGPIPEATPFVLDTLARYGIKATFFMVGDNVRKHPDVFRQVVAAGHRIGNHTYNHIGGLRWLSKNYLANTQKAEEIIRHSSQSEAAKPSASPDIPQSSPDIRHSSFDIRQSSSDIRNSSSDIRNSSFDIRHSSFVTRNSPSPLFRPPHGWMRPLQYRIIRANGYKIIMWDLVTRDYSRRLTAEEVLDNVRRYARNGSIITFHDSLRSIDKLYKILPTALEWLISEGYEFRVFD